MTDLAETERFEIAYRAFCRANGPSFPDTAKGKAAQQHHVESQWRDSLLAVTAAHSE